ncbi:LysE family translocator [Kiloniella antarctica]|uniref:LysE family translocator n=1 Tax=Kiloniella antarctica TaxID=1550907 RepID=UPI0036D3B0E6
METILGFILAAFALTGSPGPNTLSLAAVGASFGKQRGLRYMGGLNIGMVLVIIITGSGVSGLLLTIPGASPIITVIAGIYFFYLAYRISTAPPLTKDSNTGKAPEWIEGTILSLLNPKAYAAIAALFSSFVLVTDDLLLDSILKSSVLLIVICTVNISWLFIGAALTPLLKRPRISRNINISFAILLILSVFSAAVI